MTFRVEIIQFRYLAFRLRDNSLPLCPEMVKPSKPKKKSPPLLPFTVQKLAMPLQELLLRAHLGYEGLLKL